MSVDGISDEERGLVRMRYIVEGGELPQLLLPVCYLVLCAVFAVMREGVCHFSAISSFSSVVVFCVHERHRTEVWFDATRKVALARRNVG